MVPAKRMKMWLPGLLLEVRGVKSESWLSGRGVYREPLSMG
jgi:hypothetical protein